MPVVDDDAAIDRRCRPPWPSAAFGRMPAAMTTSVAGMIVPSASSTASTLPLAEDRLGVGLGDDLDAARLDRALQQIAGSRIELALHQRRHQMQHGDVHAARSSPAAASRPSRPPPMTTALARDCAASSIAWTSSRSR